MDVNGCNIRLRDFNRIVFFTGAGLSAESGIPTYRGRGGVWHQYNYEEFACQMAFDRDPEKVWDFHDVRRARVAACEPNLAHRVIAEAQQGNPRTAVITQNIDGLLQRAGCRSVVELHGSLWRVRCSREGIVREDFSVPFRPRRCSCGAYWRPDIVWFGDMLDSGFLEAAMKALSECDLLVTIGTSAVVYPAADLPHYAFARGVPSIEINPELTIVSHLYTYSLRGKASETLAALW
ncbi:MAG: NAD-dependent protein deacylase [Candidatus Hydrogenedentes bacterium]|nr:NAD-dependent protein deacylase [Candidatus Hydrogenedentota bacterium]